MPKTIDFLEPDRYSRHKQIFVIALLVLAIASGFYFVADHGCKEYTTHLKNCTPFKCTQRVKGFENKRLGHSAVMLSRNILGWEKHKYYDTATCNVIESDGVDGTSTKLCKYSETTLPIAISRSDILFGSGDLPEGTPEPNLKTARATYAERTSEQEKECSDY